MAAPIIYDHNRSESPNPWGIADDPTEVPPTDLLCTTHKWLSTVKHRAAFSKPSSNILVINGKEVILDTWERLENLYGVALRNRVVELGQVLKSINIEMRPCPGHNEGKIEWILETQKVLSSYAGQAPVASEHVPSFHTQKGTLGDTPGALSSLNGNFMGDKPLHYGEPGIFDHDVEVLKAADTEKSPPDFIEPSSNVVFVKGTRIVLDSWERLENLNTQALQDRFMELKNVLSSLGHPPAHCLTHRDAKIAWILDAQATLKKLMGQPQTGPESEELPVSVRRSHDRPGALSSLNGSWGAQKGELHWQRGIVENSSVFSRPEVFTEPSDRILEVNGRKLMLDSFEHLEYLSGLQLQNRVLQLHDILRSVGMQVRPCPGHQEDKIAWILETQQILKERFQKDQQPMHFNAAYH
eukprot:gnl/MRDRNA2_/MRDRNA2_106464_c0_seq1.p1 gnl/MRDRNA2_/MRDRNA2_106464_c0~~gnl/MRDRNA2_/MRDRNA2_106464_c0_seq1.p1  ORF type:complete len:433 (+),score=75.43 gnl/MRDRNA2_/MRDRNA2_106464_c0_seq1:64-1299(+)